MCLRLPVILGDGIIILGSQILMALTYVLYFSPFRTVYDRLYTRIGNCMHILLPKQ